MVHTQKIHPNCGIGSCFTFAPPVFQSLAAFAEFGGGIAWSLGLLTPLAPLGIVSAMVMALYTQMLLRGDPFVSSKGKPAYELAALYRVPRFS